MKGSCPSCHLLLDRGEADYFLGGYTINFVVSELLVVAGAALVISLAWPEVPWRLLTWGLMGMVMVSPVIFYPFAKTLWLAMDLIFRPLTREDFAIPGEDLLYTRAARARQEGSFRKEEEPPR